MKADPKNIKYSHERRARATASLPALNKSRNHFQGRNMLLSPLFVKGSFGTPSLKELSFIRTMYIPYIIVLISPNSVQFALLFCNSDSISPFLWSRLHLQSQRPVPCRQTHTKACFYERPPQQRKGVKIRFESKEQREGYWIGRVELKGAWHTGRVMEGAGTFRSQQGPRNTQGPHSSNGR